MRCLQVRIHGMVQGVGYRYACQREAERLGICGWVRNRIDGSVEACICGSEEALHAMRLWFEQGPPMARIDRVMIDEMVRPTSLSDFSVLPTE